MHQASHLDNSVGNAHANVMGKTIAISFVACVPPGKRPHPSTRGRRKTRTLLTRRTSINSQGNADAAVTMTTVGRTAELLTRKV
jgi:hypothetical protein